MLGEQPNDSFLDIDKLPAEKYSNEEFMRRFRAEMERIENQPYEETIEFAQSQLSTISNTELEKLLYSPRSEWQKKAEQLKVKTWLLGGRLYSYCIESESRDKYEQFFNTFFPQITITCQSNYKKHREHGKEKRKLATFKCVPLELTDEENSKHYTYRPAPYKTLNYVEYMGIYDPESRENLYDNTIFPNWECLAVARSREYKDKENQHYEEWVKTIQDYTDKLLDRLGWVLTGKNKYMFMPENAVIPIILLTEAPPFDINETDLRNVLEKAGFHKLIHTHTWFTHGATNLVERVRELDPNKINYCERLIKALADIGYTYQPKYRPYYYVRDPERPETGYQYPKYEQDSTGLITAYYFKCPCGYKIKKIYADRLNPILDRLAFNGMKEIPIQNIIKYL